MKVGTTQKREEGTNTLKKSPVKWRMKRRASKLQCLKVVWTEGQFSRLLDPGVDLYSTEGCNDWNRWRHQCFLEHKCLLELETHVLCYYLSPLSAADTPTLALSLPQPLKTLPRRMQIEVSDYDCLL